MPVFDYRARNNRGEYVKGTLDADSPSTVAEQLKATGLLPLDIKVGKSTENDKPLVLSTRSERRAKNQGIKPKDIMLFSRQMSTLQKAGVPILAALQGFAAVWPWPLKQAFPSRKAWQWLGTRWTTNFLRDAWMTCARTWSGATLFTCR